MGVRGRLAIGMGGAVRLAESKGVTGRFQYKLRERHNVEAKIGLLCVLVLTGDVDTEG